MTQDVAALTAANEKLTKENEELKEELKKVNMQMIGLRFASKIPDLEDAYVRKKAAVDVASPEVGTRVKVVNTGGKYNSNDFKTSFGEELEYTDAVDENAMGVVAAKAEHFKKKGTEVFLVKLDNGKHAVLARKGIEPAFWVGAHVTICNVGCKYAAKDFATRYPEHTITDDCHANQRGVIISIQPHYKQKTNVYLVAIDSKLRCVVMNGKGCRPMEVAGLREYTRKKEEEKKKEEETAAKGGEKAAEDEEENEDGETEKRKAEVAADGEPEAKRAKEE
eukprot:TRINITY_DN42134_c0_g1_i1.p1 TRINITY_DN42134_c0_g1~~TRINITY_DN42134_c0_g1_i1.p1  ORF type:complete len:279 (+),score=112.35 TRINITY_DN42134_c0_g1_i1:48-884(+)